MRGQSGCGRDKHPHDPPQQWLSAVGARRRARVAVCALANKMARIAGVHTRRDVSSSPPASAGRAKSPDTVLLPQLAKHFERKRKRSNRRTRQSVWTSGAPDAATLIGPSACGFSNTGQRRAPFVAATGRIDKRESFFATSSSLRGRGRTIEKSMLPHLVYLLATPGLAARGTGSFLRRRLRTIRPSSR